MRVSWIGVLFLGSVALLVLILFAIWLQALRNNRAKEAEVGVGKARFKVEIAAEPLKWRRGLIGHKPLAQGEGILFIFPFASKRSFWMKGMGFPIDIVWIRNDKVIGFVDDAPLDNGEKRYFSLEAVNKVLEIAAGERQRLGIAVGDAVVEKRQ